MIPIQISIYVNSKRTFNRDWLLVIRVVPASRLSVKPVNPSHRSPSDYDCDKPMNENDWNVLTILGNSGDQTDVRWILRQSQSRSVVINTTSSDNIGVHFYSIIKFPHLRYLHYFVTNWKMRAFFPERLFYPALVFPGDLFTRPKPTIAV